MDKFTYLGSKILSIENNGNILFGKVGIAFDMVSTMWKSFLSAKLIENFFQTWATLVLLSSSTIRTLMKCHEKKPDQDTTMMLGVVLDKFYKQHPTKHKLCNQLLPISQTIHVRWQRHAGHCWGSMEVPVNGDLLRTFKHGHYADTGYRD